MINLSDIVETRTCKLGTVTLMGFRGQNMDEEKDLFIKLNERVNEIVDSKSNKRYLVVSGKVPTPFVAVEVADSTNVPDGMNVLTIPAVEYVAFKFMKKHVGDFWANVCTVENQKRYNIDFSKPRFEIFSTELQGAGNLEWYIPINSIIKD